MHGTRRVFRAAVTAALTYLVLALAAAFAHAGPSGSTATPSCASSCSAHSG